jgi:hypothetical protein
LIQFRGGDEVHAVTGLVAERPEDDRGVVLERLDHVDDAVDVGALPGRVLGQRFPAVAHAVGLDVGLGADVEAEFVAEFVEAGVVRVVAGAHRVDIGALHQQQVIEDVLFGEVVAGDRVVVVAVDALDEDGLAVDEELAVLDLGAGEAEPSRRSGPSPCRPGP